MTGTETGRPSRDLGATAQAGELISGVPLTRPFLPRLDLLLPMLQEIWERAWLTNDGPVQRRFESALQERLGWPNVVATANGTLALQLACAALGLEGEVITSAFTFPATLQILHWNSLDPVLVDIEPTRLTIDPQAVSAAITHRTSAILAVHTFGHPADVLALAAIADRHGLALIYDAAPAVGVRVHSRPVISYGDVSAVSFHATKVMHTLEGGAVTTPRAAVADSVRSLRNFGLNDEGFALASGTNAKLNEVQAAVGLLALDQFADEIAGRADAMAAYLPALGEIPGAHVLRPGQAVEYNYAYAAVRLRKDDRPMADHVRQRLLLEGIHSRRYFSRRFQLSPGAAEGDTPNAAEAAEDVLCLPLWNGLPHAEIERVSETVRQAMA